MGNHWRVDRSDLHFIRIPPTAAWGTDCNQTKDWLDGRHSNPEEKVKGLAKGVAGDGAYTQ